jgi:hypothetical protein
MEHEFLLEENGLPLFAALVDDGDNCLAGHIAAQDNHLRAIELAGIDELFPANVGAVNVGGEEKRYHDRTLLIVEQVEGGQSQRVDGRRGVSGLDVSLRVSL